MADAHAWLTLVEKIHVGLCTPILGAGAAHHALPLAKDLAEELLRKEEALTGTAPLLVRNDLAKVAQYIAVRRKDNVHPKLKIAEHLKTHVANQRKDNVSIKTRLVERLKQSANRHFHSPDEPHRALAALRLPIYLTTNYDDLMYKALEDEGVSPVREVARWNSSLLEDVPSQFDHGYEPTPKTPLVFHIHGHWDIPESMVATDDDYLDFIVNISRDLATSPTGPSKKAMLPPRVRRALTSTTLLFIGYSLADMDFKVILRGLVGSLAPSMRQMSVSVQHCSGRPGDLEKYIEDYFGHTLRLSVFWYSAHEFCHAMNKKVNKQLARAVAAG
ncbi:MAG TPA: SIR2 family protein [Candidatus Angelobacter sp.]|jgi:hypothetical protein|nr:SIR2 family protein [Candidatus Angelobacter sp.]